jgi:hypothetical protein
VPVHPSPLPQILRRLRSRGLWLEASTGKKVCKTPSHPLRAGCVAGTCHPSYCGNINGPSWPQQKSETLSQK